MKTRLLSASSCSLPSICGSAAPLSCFSYSASTRSPSTHPPRAVPARLASSTRRGMVTEQDQALEWPAQLKSVLEHLVQPDHSAS